MPQEPPKYNKDQMARFNKLWRTDPDIVAWRRSFVEKYNEEPMVSGPGIKYDYVGAVLSGRRPKMIPEDDVPHWPSEYKADDHPNRFVKGVDTKKVSQNAPPSPPQEPEMDIKDAAIQQSRVRQILSENLSKDFVKRVIQPGKYPRINNPDGSHSTHLMAWTTVGEPGKEKYIVYPSIVHNRQTGRMTKLSGREAVEYAMKTGEYIEFDDASKAEWFSKNYKQR